MNKWVENGVWMTASALSHGNRNGCLAISYRPSFDWFSQFSSILLNDIGATQAWNEVVTFSLLSREGLLTYSNTNRTNRDWYSPYSWIATNQTFYFPRFKMSTLARSGAPEICTASKVKAHLAGTSTSPDGRLRTSWNSSTDKRIMAYDGFFNEDYRVGGPYICSIPVITYDIPEHHALYPRLVLDNDDLYHSIHSILWRNSIQTRSIRFCERLKNRSRGESGTYGLDHSYKKDVNEGWLSPCREICAFVHSKGVINVYVEISDMRAFTSDRYDLIPESDPIFPIWDHVLATILDTCDTQHWNSVGCFRIGKSNDWTQDGTIIYWLSWTHLSQTGGPPAKWSLQYSPNIISPW